MRPVVKGNQHQRERDCRDRLDEAGSPAGKTQLQPPLLLTQCPTEGFVVELPSTARLESSAHIPNPVDQRRKQETEACHCASDVSHSASRIPSLPGRQTLKPQARRDTVAQHQRSPGFCNPKCQQAGKGRTKLGLRRRGWAHSTSWEMGQPCMESSRALKMVPRKELPRN